MNQEQLIIPRTGGQFSSFWGIVLIDEMADYYAIRKHGNRKKQFNYFTTTERKIMNDTKIENKDELQQVAIEEQKEKINADIYTTREIEIEEVAIDGICGVY
jgi:mycofactocin precursor